MSNFKGESCFVIGGVDQEWNYVKSVSRYIIEKAYWEQGIPPLKVPRLCAAACSIGENIFVFSGLVNGGEFTNSVEVLHAPSITNPGA